MKKQILLSSIIASLILGGCGESSSSTDTSSTSSTIVSTTTSSSLAQLDDSPVSNIDYITQDYKGITDSNGYFRFSNTDKNITFKIGDLVIGTFNLSNLKIDRKILPADLLGIDRNNTTNTNLIYMLQFLQSLDSDNNPSNGIQISNTVKEKISQALEDNTSLKSNLLDNNLEAIKTLITDVGKYMIDAGTARRHYRGTLANIGITKLDFLPFITQWSVDSDDTVSVNINPYFTGDYNFTIDWGDGSIDKDVDNNISHTYTDAGDYNISISGKFPSAQFINETRIKNIIQWGDIKWQSFHSAFAATNNIHTNLSIVANDTPDLSEVRDMSDAFKNDMYGSTFNYLGEWNMSNVTNMNHIFYYNKSFNTNINNWDVSNVKDMSYMFYGATSFNQPLDKWDTHNVTNMSCMFYLCKTFNQNINDWNVSNVTNMSNMFNSNSVFNQPLDKWDTHNVIDMDNMLAGALSFNQNINDWNVSNDTNMSSMFVSALAFNQPLDKWDTHNVTDMSYMFAYTEEFNQSINNWDVSNVTDMSSMFKNALAFNQPLNNWDTHNLLNATQMFYNAPSFNQSLNNWAMNQVTNIAEMFRNATAFNSDISDWQFNPNNSVNLGGVFMGATSFNQPIDHWNITGVTNVQDMFYGATSFNQPLNDWNTSTILYMQYMFYGATSFSNQDLREWNVSNVENYTDFNESTGSGNLWPNFN